MNNERSSSSPSTSEPTRDDNCFINSITPSRSINNKIVFSQYLKNLPKRHFQLNVSDKSKSRDKPMAEKSDKDIKNNIFINQLIKKDKSLFPVFVSMEPKSTNTRNFEHLNLRKKLVKIKK